MMTKQDFNALAVALAKSRPDYEHWADRKQWNNTRLAIMEVLKASNPRFDPTRFIVASDAPISQEVK